MRYPRPIITPIRLKHFTSPDDVMDYAVEVVTATLRDELGHARDPYYTTIKHKLHDFTAASTRLIRAHRALIAFAQSAASFLNNPPSRSPSWTQRDQLERRRLVALALAGKISSPEPARAGTRVRHPGPRTPKTPARF